MPYSPGELDALRERCESAAALNIRRHFQFSMRWLLALPVIAAAYLSAYELPVIRGSKNEKETIQRLADSGWSQDYMTRPVGLWPRPLARLMGATLSRITYVGIGEDIRVSEMGVDDLWYLRDLDLQVPNDDDLHALRNSSSLRTLTLEEGLGDGNNVTDDGISAFGTHSNLAALSIHDCDITDASLHSLAENCRNLVYLEITDTPDVTSTGAEHLSQLQLETVNLACTSITDEGVAALCEHQKHLRNLCLEGCPVTGAFLSSLPGPLRSLELSHTAFTPEHIPALANADVELIAMESIDGSSFTFSDFVELSKIDTLYCSFYNVHLTEQEQTELQNNKTGANITFLKEAKFLQASTRRAYTDDCH